MCSPSLLTQEGSDLNSTPAQQVEELQQRCASVQAKLEAAVSDLVQEQQRCASVQAKLDAAVTDLVQEQQRREQEVAAVTQAAQAEKEALVQRVEAINQLIQVRFNCV